MRRRAFLAMLAAAAAAPAASRAQGSPAMPVVAVLGVVPQSSFIYYSDFKQGLADAGFQIGRTAAFAWYWNTIENYPGLASAVVASRPSVIVVLPGDEALTAVARATTTIPIVAILVSDPVKRGFAASWNRPGRNVTGIAFLAIDLLPKQIEMLSEALPAGAPIGVLLDPNEDAAEMDAAARAASVALHRAVILAPAARPEDFDPAVESLLQQGAAGLVIPTGAFFNALHVRIAALAAKYRIPTLYASGDLAVSGGLMAYGIRYPDMFRQLGAFAGKILAGARPAEMPIEQPARIELVVNLKTAKALGLTMPTALLVRADRVIE